ncbi:LysE/ArgO family amino acid transporter [Nocardiopsis lambiniae]|uniref:LysE/ArgO family amino acid transporter n=1 Tax=Nocardiopsis lambiniae TaxID=3075539 RepID=A0ABU2MC28_9ACTN|nr:LysE/ArgO family amino acid transporter [Nocardiopsis sp. DSM 44743]MDT0330117.1 LysE/ArgO family amino acid transporter [Nocardiopsis sp. DSM 44743]
MNATLLPALLGLGTGLALIVAIGSQNAFVLRLGIDGRIGVVLPVVLVCAVSDALLITLGVLGIGAVVAALPALVTVVRVLGAGFLLVYGALAARRALRPAGEALSVGAGATVGRGAAIATAVVLTWLNPHVYLDTVLFLGSLANQYDGARWWWAAGAVSASFLWFFSLGFGARLLRPVFARPGAWRVLDGVIALVMLALGVRMLLGA